MYNDGLSGCVLISLLIWMLLWYKQSIEIVECFSISGSMVEDRCLPAMITLYCVYRTCEESYLDFRTYCRGWVSLKGFIRLCQVHTRELHMMLFTMNDTLVIC